uniref:Uncharacterized protein n=1 Tax=Arundo donax TaxID=35708 RepID=A0A0A9F7H6_ARUDO
MKHCEIMPQQCMFCIQAKTVSMCVYISLIILVHF